MQFKQGTNVYTSDNTRVGTIQGVVVEPRTQEVSHVIVRKGFLFSEDRLIPIVWVEAITEAGLKLSKDESVFDDLTVYEEQHYIPLVPDSQAFYAYPPFGVSEAYLGYMAQPIVDDDETLERGAQLPDGSISLKKGVPVIGSDSQAVGVVERLIVSPVTNRITHFVMEEGLLFKQKKLIPVFWVDVIRDTGVFLLVNSEIIRSLPEHIPAY